MQDLWTTFCTSHTDQVFTCLLLIWIYLIESSSSDFGNIHYLLGQPAPHQLSPHFNAEMENPPLMKLGCGLLRHPVAWVNDVYKHEEKLREGFPTPLRSFASLVPLPSSRQNSWLIHKESVTGLDLSQAPWWLLMSLVEAHVCVNVFYKSVDPLLFCLSLWSSLCVISEKLDHVPDCVFCSVHSSAPWQCQNYCEQGTLGL